MCDQREMTLDEYVSRLPEYHLANKEYQQLQQHIGELSATVERLRIAALNAISIMSGGQAKADLRDAYDDTPEQNLNAIKREAVVEFTKYCTDEIERLYGWEGAVIEAESIIRGLTLTANQRYPDKE